MTTKYRQTGATPLEFKDLLDDFVEKNQKLSDLFEQSDIFKTCKPFPKGPDSLGFLEKYGAFRDYVHDEIYRYSQNMEISLKNRRNEFVELNYSVFVIWERILGRLNVQFINDTRLTKEHHASGEVKEATNKIMNIILKRGINGVMVHRYKEIEDVENYEAEQNLLRAEHHRSNRIRDMAAQTENLIGYMRTQKERAILMSRQLRMEQKFIDEVLFFLLCRSFEEYAVRYKEITRKTLKTQQLILLPPRRPSPAPRVIPGIENPVLQPSTDSMAPTETCIPQQEIRLGQRVSRVSTTQKESPDEPMEVDDVEKTVSEDDINIADSEDEADSEISEIDVVTPVPCEMLSESLEVESEVFKQEGQSEKIDEVEECKNPEDVVRSRSSSDSQDPQKCSNTEHRRRGSGDTTLTLSSVDLSPRSSPDQMDSEEALKEPEDVEGEFEARIFEHQNYEDLHEQDPSSSEVIPPNRRRLSIAGPSEGPEHSDNAVFSQNPLSPKDVNNQEAVYDQAASSTSSECSEDESENPTRSPEDEDVALERLAPEAIARKSPEYITIDSREPSPVRSLEDVTARRSESPDEDISDYFIMPPREAPSSSGKSDVSFKITVNPNPDVPIEYMSPTKSSEANFIKNAQCSEGNSNEPPAESANPGEPRPLVSYRGSSERSSESPENFNLPSSSSVSKPSEVPTSSAWPSETPITSEAASSSESPFSTVPTVSEAECLQEFMDFFMPGQNSQAPVVSRKSPEVITLDDSREPSPELIDPVIDPEIQEDVAAPVADSPRAEDFNDPAMGREDPEELPKAQKSFEDSSESPKSVDAVKSPENPRDTLESSEDSRDASEPPADDNAPNQNNKEVDDSNKSDDSKNPSEPSEDGDGPGANSTEASEIDESDNSRDPAEESGDDNVREASSPVEFNDPESSRDSAEDRNIPEDDSPNANELNFMDDSRYFSDLSEDGTAAEESREKSSPSPICSSTSPAKATDFPMTSARAHELPTTSRASIPESQLSPPDGPSDSQEKLQRELPDADQDSQDSLSSSSVIDLLREPTIEELMGESSSELSESSDEDGNPRIPSGHSYSGIAPRGTSPVDFNDPDDSGDPSEPSEDGDPAGRARSFEGINFNDSDDSRDTSEPQEDGDASESNSTEVNEIDESDNSRDPSEPLDDDDAPDEPREGCSKSSKSSPTSSSRASEFPSTSEASKRFATSSSAKSSGFPSTSEAVADLENIQNFDYGTPKSYDSSSYDSKPATPTHQETVPIAEVQGEEEEDVRSDETIVLSSGGVTPQPSEDIVAEEAESPKDIELNDSDDSRDPSEPPEEDDNGEESGKSGQSSQANKFDISDEDDGDDETIPKPAEPGTSPGSSAVSSSRHKSLKRRHSDVTDDDDDLAPPPPPRH